MTDLVGGQRVCVAFLRLCFQPSCSSNRFSSSGPTDCGAV